MSEYAIQRRTPTSVTVLAILHLVGGGLGLVLGICGGVFLLAGGAKGGLFGQAQAQQGGPAVIAEATENIPGQRAVTVGQFAVDLTLNIMLITAGIGLLRMQPWARSLSLVYAVLSILFHICTAVWAAVYVLPVVQDAIAAEAARNPKMAPALDVARAVMIPSLFIGHIWIIYPVVVLCILLSRSVTAAFRGEPRADGVAEEREDAGWRPMRPPGGRDDITSEPDEPYRGGFRPPEG
jgi:hypothetical protein